MTIDIFSQIILNWYHFHGRKNLPWQKDKQLYYIWISEIMLQQTKVKSVIPYFKKFILTFPDLISLINSSLDQILYLWSGLGYYNRAKNIYKTAQIIKEKHNSKFPENFVDILNLPGIGRSTAGSIISFSLNAFFPILDSNIKRILIRFYNIQINSKKSEYNKKLWNTISVITPLHNTAKFNQAMIDLGSLICKPKNPKCHICPIKKKCSAYIKQNWDLSSPKKELKKRKESYFLIIKYKKNIWLEKNIKKNLWNNLFYPPCFDQEIMLFNWLKKNHIKINYSINMESFIHIFSHFQLKINPIVIKVSYKNNFFNMHKTGIWYNIKNPQHIGIPAPIKKIILMTKKI